MSVHRRAEVIRISFSNRIWKAGLISHCCFERPVVEKDFMLAIYLEFWHNVQDRLVGALSVSPRLGYFFNGLLSTSRERPLSLRLRNCYSNGVSALTNSHRTILFLFHESKFNTVVLTFTEIRIMTDTETETKVNGSEHRRPEIEQFLNLNTMLHSLVDFIRPETFIAQEELETYNELKDKFLRESASKQRKQQAKSPGTAAKSTLEVAGVQSIRTASGIYRFLAHHHSRCQLARPFMSPCISFPLENSASTVNKKQTPSQPITRDELLKKLHEKMPHRQQQAGEYLSFSTRG